MYLSLSGSISNTMLSAECVCVCVCGGVVLGSVVHSFSDNISDDARCVCDNDHDNSAKMCCALRVCVCVWSILRADRLETAPSRL